MDKALIYCRVSTEEQAEEGRYSMKTQKRLCESHIETGGEYKLATEGVYEDPGKSATNMSRSGLQDLIIRVQEDKSIGAVFVQDTDRLARNVMDHLTIKALLEKNEVILISVSQPSIEDSPEGNFMDLIMAGVNQLQSQITGRKVMKSMENRFKDGWYPTKAPLGYLNVGEEGNEEKRIIIQDPEKAPLVRELFTIYATGVYSMFDIRDTLYKKGLIAYRGNKPGRTLLFSILENSFYYGEMHWGGMIGKGKHKPLITKELFNQCQKIRAERNRFARRDRKYNFLYNGLIFSATTGRRYVGEKIIKKGLSYYRCHGNRDKKLDPNDKPIRMNVFDEYVKDVFLGIQFSDKFIDKVVAKVKQIYDKKRTDVMAGKIVLENQRLGIKNKLETAEEKLISGTLSDNDFTRIKNRLREQIENAEDEINRLDRSKNVQIDVIQELLALIREIGIAYSDAPIELRRVYLSLFWERFEVSNRKIVNAEPTKIVKALVSTGSICLNKRQKPVPIEQVFAHKSPFLREEVGIRNIRLSQPSITPIIAVFSDREYMAEIREKLQFISCQKGASF